MALGEAVWQLVASGETVTQEAIARMIIDLSQRRPDLADSIALSVLHSAKKSPGDGADFIPRQSLQASGLI